MNRSRHAIGMQRNNVLPISPKRIPDRISTIYVAKIVKKQPHM